MKRFGITFALAVTVIFSLGTMASAVSFYPLPEPVAKDTPKADRPPSTAVGVYATTWEVGFTGGEPISFSGNLVTIESSVGENYVLGGALNSVEGETVWEAHVTRRLGGGWGVQTGALFWEGGYTDLQLVAMKSTKRKPDRPWAADFGFGLYYWDADPGLEETAGTAFVAASYDLTKNITANLSLWTIALEDFTVTRSAAGVGYRF